MIEVLIIRWLRRWNIYKARGSWRQWDIGAVVANLRVEREKTSKCFRAYSQRDIPNEVEHAKLMFAIVYLHFSSACRSAYLLYSAAISLHMIDKRRTIVFKIHYSDLKILRYLRKHLVKFTISNRCFCSVRDRYALSIWDIAEEKKSTSINKQEGRMEIRRVERLRRGISMSCAELLKLKP